MNLAIEISLCVLAWFIALNRGRTALLNRAWETDRIAFGVGSASLFFAFTMTFLITPLGNLIDNLTYPNLSRLLAYVSVSITLYLTTSSCLLTFPTDQNTRRLKLLKPYLLITLGLLLLSYGLGVAHTPEWIEQPVPGSVAEMIFKLVVFTHAAILCAIIAVACYQYTSQEKVIVTKYRIAAISFTAMSGAAYFLTKTILSLGFVWPRLETGWLFNLSKSLLVGTAMLWGTSFIHSNLYARVLALFRGLRTWNTYRDLEYLVKQLEHLCPPVGMEMAKPSFWQFLRNSDYHLYRAMVHILDGKTLIADFLADTIPANKLQARWDQNGYLEAVRLNNILKGIEVNDDFLEMLSEYRLAGRKLMGAIS